MEKNRLLIIPLLIGLILMLYSWYLSYPLSIDSSDDYIFNHVSVLYWISLPLLLSSMYFLAVSFKNQYSKWIMVIAIITTMYSLSYFYYLLPGSDSAYYRGLFEYFKETKNLDPSQPGKSYFQWPCIFILTDVATSVSGLSIGNFEFLMYAILGLLLASALYIYVSKVYKIGSFIAVIAFFLAMRYYLNYQFAAFTIALSFLFLMFTLDNKEKNPRIMIMILILFIGMLITHLYSPLFFTLYLLVRYIINREKHYRDLFLLTLVTWALFQITIASKSFSDNIWLILNRETEVSLSSMVTVSPAVVPINEFSQIISIATLVTTVLLCVAGTTILLIRRKMRDIDKAIFLFAVCYFGLGVIVYVLGHRTIPIAFIPVSLGAAFLFKSRLRPYIKYLLLVLLILFLFTPLHSSFSKIDVFNQTEETLEAENFFIENYNWDYHIFFANYRVINYLESKSADQIHYRWRIQRLNETDTIFYTVGLGLTLSRYNYTIEKIICDERPNLVYNNGFSMVITNLKLK